MVLATPKKTVGPFQSNGPFLQKICRYSSDSIESAVWRKGMEEMKRKGGGGGGWLGGAKLAIGVAVVAAGAWYQWWGSFF